MLFILKSLAMQSPAKERLPIDYLFATTDPTDSRIREVRICTTLFGISRGQALHFPAKRPRMSGHAVAEETSEGAAEMKDLTSTSFGYVIAFLLPGLLGLYALSYWSGAVDQLLQPAIKADATVGPSVILLLIALGIGLCVSAIRFFVFEKFLCRKHHFPKDMFAKLTEETKLVSFKAVVDEHYRYHQFYGGCAVVLVVVVAGWSHTHLHTASCGKIILLVLGSMVLEWMLVQTASDAFKRYVERGTTIVQGGEVTHDHQ